MLIIKKLETALSLFVNAIIIKKTYDMKLMEPKNTNILSLEFCWNDGETLK